MNRGYIFIFLATVFFSSMEVALKTVAHDFNPMQLNCTRFLVGGLLLIPFALRGLRTMKVRMEKQFSQALELARWLETRPEVLQVLYPPLESHPGHALWARDFTGGGSLFSIVLPKMEKKAVAAMLNGYRLFSIGASWGGFDSLVEHCHPERTALNRKAPVWNEDNCTLVRYAIGLEDVDDLKADLEEGFARLRAALS